MEFWEYQAFHFAQHAHRGQVDKEGKDYFFNHILPVVNILKMAIRDNESFSRQRYREMVTATYLHDVIEDCEGFTPQMILENFDSRVLNLVLEVTHTDTNTFPRLKTLDGYIIKFADRLANLSRRQGGLNDEEIADYMERSVFWKV